MYSRCFHWFPGPLAPSVLQVGPYYEDINGEYCGSGVVEEEGETRVGMHP